ncbi:hypothetical protein D3C83_20690 [compost metagenome]
MRVNLPVERELVVAQREPREQRVLLDHEVGNGDSGKQIGLRQRAQLRCALEQEIELRRQRVARAVLVEAGQKRVGIRVLQKRLSARALAHHARQARLARADRALDDDVAVLVGQLRAHVRTKPPMNADERG